MMPYNLDCRCVLPEVMDDPELDAREHRRALRGLARLHAITRTTRRLWQRIRAELSAEPARELSVLDVGCGDGHLLRGLSRCARSRGIELKLTGCDVSRRALAICEEQNRSQQVVMELYPRDVITDPLPCEADIVICSLFLHHFDTDAAALLLRKLMAATRRLMVVDDLLRSRLGYAACWLGIHLMTRSAVVRTDGLLSVRAAFTLAEMRTLLARVGMQEATVQRSWPERLLITWRPKGAC